MPTPNRSRYLRKDHVATHFKAYKPQVYSETAIRPSSTLAPNIRSLSWSPLGNQIACSTSVNIRVWNPERPDVKSSTEMKDGRSAHGSAVEKVAFNPRVEGVLASTGLDGMVKLWDVRLPTTSVGIFQPAGPSSKGSLSSKSGEYKVGDQGLFLTWHPDGMEMLVGRRDDVVQAVDIRRLDAPFEPSGATAKYELTPEDRTPVKDRGNFNMMAFSNSGREVFATTADGPVKILDYPSMQPIYTLSANSSSAYAVQHSPAGNYVAVGASDSLITLWDTTNWFCMHTLHRHTSAVRDVSFSFDGNYLVVGSGTDTSKDGDKGLEVYHVDTGELVHTIETTNIVTYVAWHPFRYAVAYAGDPGGMKIVGSISGS